MSLARSATIVARTRARAWFALAIGVSTAQCAAGTASTSSAPRASRAPARADERPPPGDPLMTAAAAALSCAPDQVQVVGIDQRTRGFAGCGRRVAYIEECDYANNRWTGPQRTDCLWRPDPDPTRTRAVLPPGPPGGIESTLMTRAIFDLGCPAASMRMAMLPNYQRMIEGCGRRALYAPECDVMQMTQGDRVEHVAPYNCTYSAAYIVSLAPPPSAGEVQLAPVTLTPDAGASRGP